MNWKIIFLLASLNILVIAPRTSELQGESSRSTENEQEYLEELYDGNFVQLLNSITTLARTPANFFGYDIEFLTKEFYTNRINLNVKKLIVRKYRRKMQEIQCINGLLVLHILGELQACMHQKKITVLKNLLNQLVVQHVFYLTRMLSMLHIAKWNPYPWQIEIFTFVMGLRDSDANCESYRDHFINNNERIEKSVNVFVTKCVRARYLVHQSKDNIEENMVLQHLVDNVQETVDSLYKDDANLAYAYSLADHYTVPNLMLTNLHSNHEFIYDWSNFNIEFKTNNVVHRLTEYLTVLRRQQLSHQWELDPIEGNKYNALIAECIHLRVVYFTWFHLYTYRMLLSRPPAVNESEMQVTKNELLSIWHMLVIPLKYALRAFRFNENIYWAAIYDMMAKIDTISFDELAARERFTRNYFCQAVEKLGLAEASDVSRQLTKVKVEEDYLLVSESILNNANMLHDYTDRILRMLGKYNGAFVRLIVSAEGNKIFIVG